MYTGDLKTDLSKSRNNQNLDFLKIVPREGVINDHVITTVLANSLYSANDDCYRSSVIIRHFLSSFQSTIWQPDTFGPFEYQTWYCITLPKSDILDFHSGTKPYLNQPTLTIWKPDLSGFRIPTVFLISTWSKLPWAFRMYLGVQRCHRGGTKVLGRPEEPNGRTQHPHHGKVLQQDHPHQVILQMSPDETVHMFGLLYVHQKREDFCPSLFVTSLQGSTPLSLILLPILSVSLLHTALTSRPSYLAGKGAERRIGKTQTYTTVGFQIPTVLCYSDTHCICT